MSDVYESIVAGLQEAIEDAKSKEKKLPRRVVTVVPVKEYNASEVKKIRNETGMSQKTFASYLGVSCKTVEAWESGINHPYIWPGIRLEEKSDIRLKKCRGMGYAAWRNYRKKAMTALFR